MYRSFQPHRYKLCVYHKQDKNKQNKKPKGMEQWNNSKSFGFHKNQVRKVLNDKNNNLSKHLFYQLLFKRNGLQGLNKTITNELYKMTHLDKISVLWLVSCLQGSRRRKRNYRRHSNSQIPPNPHNICHRSGTPPISNKTHKQSKVKALGSTNAFNVEHETQARNNFPAHDLPRGWVIDSGASAHMTPFKKDCKNIQPTQRKIFLADGSMVMCKEMGTIDIPISNDKNSAGTLILDDVLIVPSLDRRLFSVNSFLGKGNNWVHFEKDSIILGIRTGPKVNVPITSLQSNALIVGTRNHKRTRNENRCETQKKKKISTNIIHDRFHRSHGAIATIQAHNLWEDVHVTQGTDSVCTSCKIMTIPAASRGKPRSTQVRYPLEEIQVDTVPNPEPLGLSSESRYNYFLILCDRYSRIFRLIGIHDKTSEACIDGIELLTSNIPSSPRRLRSITHIRSDAGTEFRSDVFRKWCSEKGIRFSSAAPKHQEQNGLVERH